LKILLLIIAYLFLFASAIGWMIATLLYMSSGKHDQERNTSNQTSDLMGYLAYTVGLIGIAIGAIFLIKRLNKKRKDS
jgi:H+/Cl- antiporter ClcA